MKGKNYELFSYDIFRVSLYGFFSPCFVSPCDLLGGMAWREMRKAS